MADTQVPGDASVSSHNQYGGHVTLQGSVDEGETLNIQHVNLINEQYLQPMVTYYNLLS